MGSRQGARCHRCGTPLADDNDGSYCAPCTAVSRDRFTVPPEVPATFWDDQEVKEALATRHMGRVIRAYRHHPFHGRQPLPQDALAIWIGVTQGQLSRIENGPTIVHLDRLIHWARILRIPASKLWFTLPEGKQATSPGSELSSSWPLTPNSITDVETSRWFGTADTVEIVSRFTRGDLALDRREIGRALVGVLAGTKLLEPLEGWLLTAEESPRGGRPGGVGYQEVEQIEKAARLFRDWDDQFGGGLRRKAVVGQLNEIADLLHDAHPEPIRRRLFGAMAQLAETTAIMSWDSGYQALAQRYYLMAIRAAKMAGDRAFAANIMAGMARQLLYLGHVSDALEIVRLAQDRIDGHATPRMRAMLHTREAWAFAKMGRVSAFRHATAKAEDALDRAKPSEDPHWIRYFDLAELEGTTGGRLLDMAHHDRHLAEETSQRIERAIASRRPGRLRSSALDRIGLAEARLVQGEPDEAARLGHEALSLVEQTPSDRVSVKLAELFQHCTSQAGIPAIADLRDRIRALLVARSV